MRSPMAINTPNSLSEVHLAEWVEVAGADTGDGTAQGGMADVVGAGGALRVFQVRAWHYPQVGQKAKDLGDSPHISIRK